MKLYCDFNKIFVIESLFQEDKKTGQNLFNDVLRWKESQIQSQLNLINTKKEFLNLLEDIKIEINKKGMIPFLHLEMHGNENKDGLVINNGELITWLELVNRFREINILTKHNLVVSLATCYGAYIYGEMNIAERAPFWAFIGPWGKLDPIDIEISYSSFFETLLSTFDIDEAIKVLNESNQLPHRYSFYDSETVFERVYEKYEQEQYAPEQYKKRVIDIMGDALKDRNIRNTFTIPELKMRIEQILVGDKDRIKHEERKKFLME